MYSDSTLTHPATICSNKWEKAKVISADRENSFQHVRHLHFYLSILVLDIYISSRCAYDIYE